MSFLPVPREDLRTRFAPALQDSRDRTAQFPTLRTHGWLAGGERLREDADRQFLRQTTPRHGEFFRRGKMPAPTLVPILMRTKSLTPCAEPRIVLALRGKVHIVLNDHEAASDLAEHGAQRNRAPALEGADRKHAAFLHICDGRHADHQRQQLVPALSRACAEVSSTRRRSSRRSLPGWSSVLTSEISSRSSSLPFRSVSRKEMLLRGDFHRKQAATFRLEANHVWRPSAAGRSFAERLNQIRRKQILHNVGDRGRAEPGGAHQICSASRSRIRAAA